MSNSSSSDICEMFSTSKLSDEKEPVVIDQYAQNVIDFSSQYGSDYSISYTAYNITGRPSKFPDYGDFPETFAMRTYGKWWDRVPSRETTIMPQNLPTIPVHDFIVIQFEEFVIPLHIKIYETYNPGAIINIWSYNIDRRWTLLWTGSPTHYVDHKSREFSPVLAPTQKATRILRLEFNHSKLNYFTEIDGVILMGRRYSEAKKPILSILKPVNKNSCIIKELEKIDFKVEKTDNVEIVFKDFVANDLEHFMNAVGLLTFDDRMPAMSLQHLPHEILFKIFGLLDLVSLFCVSRVCKKFNEIATNQTLYNELNLKPYWYCVTAHLLKTLSERSKLLKKLDLSWCGFFGSINAIDFKMLLKVCGKNLHTLRLNSCHFLNTSCVEMVGSICSSLKELSLRNYFPPNNFNYSPLAHLQQLERLDLFRSSIEVRVILKILENNPNLKHLNLGCCGATVSMDIIAQQIGKCNRNIISIDMWKSHSLSSVGLKALSSCVALEEVDFGWCLREESSPGESLKALLRSSVKLRKLFLAAVRGLSDRDLEKIPEYCAHIEQLDLMGVMGLTTETCYKILTKCKHLKLFDISFCEQLDDIQIAMWKRTFDVDIKRNITSTDFFL